MGFGITYSKKHIIGVLHRNKPQTAICMVNPGKLNSPRDKLSIQSQDLAIAFKFIHCINGVTQVLYKVNLTDAVCSMTDSPSLS